MSDDPFPVARLFDATNAVVSTLNTGDREGVIRQIQAIRDDFAPLCPFPLEAHPALHTLAQCMLSSGTLDQYRDFLSMASFCPDRDKEIRQSVNNICTLLNQGSDTLSLRNALRGCITTHIRENVIYPHMEDVFKLLRTLSVVLAMPELQLPIDRARYHSGCISSDNAFANKPTGRTDVIADETPGFQLLSEGDCPISAVIETFGVYEPTSMQVWASLATDGDVIVDVGAHIGFYALLAASVNASADILAFEPNPDAFERLCDNVRINEFSNISCYPVAAARTPGTVEFQYLTTGSKRMISTVGSSTGRHWEGGGTITVETQSLDDPMILGRLANRHDPRVLVKIDTEGKEGDVIEGASDFIATSRPDILVESFNTKACDQINATLKPYAFRYFRISEGTHTLTELDKMKPAFLSRLENFNTLATCRTNDKIRQVLGEHVRLEFA